MSTIFLTGTPESRYLDWDRDLLLWRYDERIKRFLGLPEAAQTLPQSSHHVARWRNVTDAHNDRGEDRQVVLPPHFLPFPENDDHLHFLEHSLAIINDLNSSHLAPAGNMSALPEMSFTTSTADTPLGTTRTSFSLSSPTKTGILDEEPPNGFAYSIGAITDIRRMPNAEHVNRIHPQKITVNLLAAVISVSCSRTVRLRKRDAEMDIVEVLVGDETGAGFSISFWLVPKGTQRKPDDDLRTAVAELRAGHVVIFQNIALSAFKGCVYGQSLSRRFARNSTILTGLTKAQDVPDSLTAKYKYVRSWSDDFVGASTSAVQTRSGAVDLRRHDKYSLPPDTQPHGT